jgi:SAM-dependent methyltransferase
LNVSEYLLGNQYAEAGRRLAALAALFDPSTFRHLEAVGIGQGWRCWEVGAGATSVVCWLADRVGCGGRVLATDIDVSWVREAAGHPVEVRQHDVGREAPPPEAFDLVHARLVLVHVPERDRALQSMASVLRPGGWLVVEDADPALQPLSCLDVRGPEEERANRIRTGFRTLMAERGVDLAYGRKLPRLLREVGLEDVAADAYFPIAKEACTTLEVATMSLIRSDLIAHGVATPTEIDQHVTAAIAGHLDLAQPPMVTAWGRRPG